LHPFLVYFLQTGPSKSKSKQKTDSLVKFLFFVALRNVIKDFYPILIARSPLKQTIMRFLILLLLGIPSLALGQKIDYDSIQSAIDQTIELVESGSKIKCDTFLLTEDEYESSGLLLFYYNDELIKIKEYLSDGAAGDASEESTFYLHKDQLICAYTLSSCFVGNVVTISNKAYFYQGRMFKLDAEQHFYKSVGAPNEMCDNGYGFSEESIGSLFQEWMAQIKELSRRTN